MHLIIGLIQFMLGLLNSVLVGIRIAIKKYRPNFNICYHITGMAELRPEGSMRPASLFLRLLDLFSVFFRPNFSLKNLNLIKIKNGINLVTKIFSASQKYKLL
jgi:hypothetical protein